MADFGYDVSDYCDIASDLRDLADFDRLIAAAHRRGLKVILDFVPNHTSEQHPWFMESRSLAQQSQDETGISGGTATRRCPQQLAQQLRRLSVGVRRSKQDSIIYHSFLKEQPDLNWRNPEVRQAMFNVLRFWLRSRRRWIPRRRALAADQG